MAASSTHYTGIHAPTNHPHTTKSLQHRKALTQGWDAQEGHLHRIKTRHGETHPQERTAPHSISTSRPHSKRTLPSSFLSDGRGFNTWKRSYGK